MDRKLYRFSAALLSLALLLSGVFAGSPAAASKRSGRKTTSPSEKISPDLRESARRKGGELVTVIVQPKGEWGDEQEGTVRAHGGRVKHKFENMDERVVEVPAGAVEALAARDDVAYVSPERETEATPATSSRRPAASCRTRSPGARSTARASASPSWTRASSPAT